MYNILLIEDHKDDSDACIKTVKRMNEENMEEKYHVTVASTFDEAIDNIKDRDYQGVIVDIKLDGENSGNDVIHQIIDSYRMPVVVMTGTPDTDLELDSPIKIYKKGEARYDEIIIALEKANQTGLFNVIGGKGIIEKTMNKVFWENLYPQINVWEEYAKNEIDTEKILLRYTVAHIMELLDEEGPNYCTEEMYIKPPVSLGIHTGTIVQSNNDNKHYIVLSPPCDLAIHNGNMKTDRILLCEIDDFSKVNSEALKGYTKADKKRKALKDILKNNYVEYYHWLPENCLFPGGYVNFRNVITFTPEEYVSEFGDPLIKIQEFFVKSILNRFSTYYARQGQPDFDFEVEGEIVYNKYFAE